MAARRKTKKVQIPIAPVEREPAWSRSAMAEVESRDKARHAADEVYAQPEPVKSPVEPPAHVCTVDGKPLDFVREVSPGKRVYHCASCDGAFLFKDDA